MTQPALLSPPWDTLTLPDLARRYAAERPQQILFRETDIAAAVLRRPVRQIDGKAFLGAARLMASQLRDLGVVEGERVLVVAPNSIETMITICAAIMAGAVPAMLPVFAEAHELRQAISLVNAVGIVTVSHFSGLAPARRARDVAAAQLDVRFVAAFGTDCPAGVDRLDEWPFVAEEVAQPLPSPRPDDVALITFDTSGDSLRAFGRTHGQLVAEALLHASAADIGAGSRIIATLAPATIAGLTFSLCVPLLTGCTVELLPLFDSCSFAAQLGDGEGTVLVLPAGAEAALRHYRAARVDCSETNVFVHRPQKRTVTPLQPLAAAARTIDVAWFGECFGLVVKRTGPQDQRQIYVHAGVAADSLRFMTGPRHRLTVTGSRVPLLPDAAVSIETTFSVEDVRRLAGGVSIDADSQTEPGEMRRTA